RPAHGGRGERRQHRAGPPRPAARGRGARRDLEFSQIGLPGGLGLRQRRAPQRVAGGAVAELLAGGRAGAWAQDVAQVGLVLERLRVLLVVAGHARALGRAAVDGGRLLEALLRDVDRPRAVAGLALHVLELGRVAEAGAAHLAVAGHVAADALVVGL